MSSMKVEITKLSSGPSKTIGYAEGKLKGRGFAASWGAGQPLGALFFDTWLDARDSQIRAIAAAFTEAKAVPPVQAA